MITSIAQLGPSEGDFLSVRKYQDKSCDKVSPLTEVKVALLDSHLWRIPIFVLLSQSLSLTDSPRMLLEAVPKYRFLGRCRYLWKLNVYFGSCFGDISSIALRCCSAASRQRLFCLSVNLVQDTQRDTNPDRLVLIYNNV